MRFSAQRIKEELVPLVMKAAEEISAKLGYTK
jgi:DNA-binding IclR family transcriptional regulator